MAGADHCFEPRQPRFEVVHFVKPLSVSLTAIDYRLLCVVNAFQAPKTSVLQDIFQTFHDLVYWDVPVIVPRVPETIQQQDQPHKLNISIILLHAITLTTIPYLSVKTLQDAGYNSYQEARTALCNKVKVCSRV